MFAEFIENFSIFLISESKLDDTFPNRQFHINGFKIFKCDRNRYRGGLIYVHEGIPCKPLKILPFDLKIEIAVKTGHLNINSFRNKYEMFAEFIENFNVSYI